MTLTADNVLAPRPSWTARIRQYQDGVELELVKRTAVGLLDLLLAGSAMAMGGLALYLVGPETGPWWALAFWLCGLVGVSTFREASREGFRTRRALFAHGASETFILAGTSPGQHLGGGASEDLVVALEPSGPDTSRLRVFTAAGETDLGGPVLLPSSDAAAVRRFAALSGVRVIGLH